MAYRVCLRKLQHGKINRQMTGRQSQRLFLTMLESLKTEKIISNNILSVLMTEFGYTV